MVGLERFQEKMNLNWLGIISIILALAAFFVTFRTAKKLPTKAKIFVTFVAMIVALPTASFSVYYAHVIPEASWYYELRSIAGSEFLMGFVGIAGGMVATLVPRIMLTLPLLGVVVLSVVPIIKPLIGPIPRASFQDQWDGVVCLQSTPSTCGAASTATILKYFGENVTEAAIATEAHSYSGGTEAWYLARAFRSRGYDAKFSFRAGFTPEDGLPAIVGVMMGSAGHFIAIIEHNGDKYLIGDPLRGREVLSRAELERRYKFTGFHMQIKRRGE
jgi:hypothetical protein